MFNAIKTASKESFFYKIPTLIGDLLIQVGVLLFMMYGTGKVRENNMLIYAQHGTWFLLIISNLLVAVFLGIKIHERDRSAVNILNRALLNATLTWIAFNGSMAIIYELTLQGKLLALQLLMTGVLTAAWHLAMRSLVILVRKKGANHYTMVMVGTDSNMLSIYKDLSRSDNDGGYKILGFFTDRPEEVPDGAHLFGRLDEVIPFLEKEKDDVKEVLCSISPERETAYVNGIVNCCENHMIRFKYVPNMDGYPQRNMQITPLGNVNVISLHDEPLNHPYAQIVKRAFDIAVSGLFLVTLFPLIWCFCAIGIKLSSPKGPVFFRQKRTGYEGKEFWCLKFRSMHPSSDADTKQATRGDARVFRFGEFLRKSSLDELPQFINVFRGDMSIIGPRPHMVHHTDVYSALIGAYMVRHYATPGITGWAQVNGCRGETRELSEMKARVEKDIWYIEHWSIELDMTIFLMTIWQLIRHQDEKAY